MKPLSKLLAKEVQKMALPKPKKDYGRIIENIVVTAVLIGLMVAGLIWMTGCSLFTIPVAAPIREIKALPNPSTIMAQAEVPWWMWILGWATTLVMSMFGSHKVRKMDHRRQQRQKAGPYGECKWKEPD